METSPVPHEYFVCGPRPGGFQQPTVSYSRAEVQAALHHGLKALYDREDEDRATSAPRTYPTRFRNDEGFAIWGRADPNDLWEFPITRDSQNNHVLYNGNGYVTSCSTPTLVALQARIP